MVQIPINESDETESTNSYSDPSCACETAKQQLEIIIESFDGQQDASLSTETIAQAADAASDVCINYFRSNDIYNPTEDNLAMDLYLRVFSGLPAEEKSLSDVFRSSIPSEHYDVIPDISSKINYSDGSTGSYDAIMFNRSKAKTNSASYYGHIIQLSLDTKEGKQTLYFVMAERKRSEDSTHSSSFDVAIIWDIGDQYKGFIGSYYSPNRFNSMTLPGKFGELLKNEDPRYFSDLTSSRVKETIDNMKFNDGTKLVEILPLDIVD